MRILVVSQYYPPEMAAGGIRVAEMVPGWLELGHDVTVLTAVPNYPDGVVPPGYRWKLRVVEQGPSGEELHRAGLVPAGSGNLLRRGIKFLSFGTTASATGSVLPVSPDVVVATSPPPTVGAVGRLLAERYGVPFVLDVRDLWPETVAEVADVPRPVLEGLHLLAGWLYRIADRVVVVSRAFEGRILQDRGSSQAEDIVFVPNGVDLQAFPESGPETSGVREELGIPQNDMLLMYVGTFGLCQDLARLEEAYGALGARNLHTCLVGGGAQEEALRAMAKRIDALTVPGRQPRERVPRLYAVADVGLVVLRDTPVMETVIPSKVFEIMASRKPVLLVGGGEVRRIIETTGAGLCVDADDINGFLEAAERLRDPTLRDRLGSAGRRAVEERFNRTVLSRQYVELLEELVRPESEAGTRRETSRPRVQRTLG